MDRMTRLTVLGSLLAALALQVTLVARAYPPVESASLVIFLAALTLSLALPRLGPALVLSFTYVAPALISVFVHSRSSNYLCLWFAALIAPPVAAAGWRQWRFPRAWTWPLVLWMLCIALTWPIVVLRECDFNLGLLSVVHLANSGMGIPPPVEAIGIASTALTLGLPLLWLDWLFGRFEQDRFAELVRWIVAPLAVSWLLSEAAALYQAFVDMNFLNGGLFGYMGRASGAMLDANPFGVITAMWGAGLFGLAIGSRRRTVAAAGVVILLLSWIGIWASGSRTAFGASAVALVCLAAAAFRSIRSRRTRAWVVGGLATSSAIAALIVVLTPAAGVSGFSRLRNTLPHASIGSIDTFAAEMWNRNHYGEASTAMISAFPLVGIGVGSFETLVVDFGKRFNGNDWLTPDNAQNWFRHQLAQTGLLGSLGWIIWLVILAAFFWRTLRSSPAAAPRRFEADVVAGILLALGLMSLVGMPTANTAAALTFAVFLFWYVALVGEPENSGRLRAVCAPASQGHSWRAWAAMGVIVVTFVAGTAYVGATKLRPPYRALRYDWEYISGFHEMEHAAGDTPFRWTLQRAVDVFPVENLFLKLTFRIHNPDAKQHPVEAKIWLKNRLITDVTLDDGTPVTEYVRAPEGQKRMMIETWVSRTWRPSDYGQKDTRELGLAIDDWTFVDKPPAGATVVQ